MIERLQTHLPEEAEEIGDIYLRNLGLQWDQLQGKKVLDIGAMNAAFENVARRRGADMTSVDNTFIEGDYAPPKDSHYVIANATKLPFADEAFDCAIAHTSVMNYIEKEYKDDEYIKYIEDALREACRVLKVGGQFRFTRTLLDEQELREGNEVVPEAKTDAYDTWIAEREHRFLETIAKHAGFKELQVVRYTGEQLAYTKANYNDVMNHYFIAIK